jgi:transposase
MLNLPGITVASCDESDPQRYVFRVKVDGAPAPCCAQPLVKNGSKTVTYDDLRMHRRHVVIEVERQRFYCKLCRKTHILPLPEMDDEFMMTKRLVAEIEQQSLETTFAHLSRYFGVTDRTVGRIFDRYAKRELSRLYIETPEWMGLDEIHALSGYRGVVTNVKQRTLVDILENRKKPTILGFLNKIPDKQRVKIVTMDMWMPYKDAVRVMLPDALIVVDRYHVTKMALEAMERVRIEYRKSLPLSGRLALKNDRWLMVRNGDDVHEKDRFVMSLWFHEHPALGEAYRAKEGFRKVWQADTIEEGKQRYDEWEKGLSDDIRPAFNELTAAMRNWREPIFNYFHARTTNAYTEALNGITRIVNRAGRGYSFKVLRARMLLSYGNHAMHGGRGTGMGKRRPDPWNEPGWPSWPYSRGIKWWRFTRNAVACGPAIKQKRS